MSPHSRVHQSSLPGLWKAPTFLETPEPTSDDWLKGKKIDDNTGGLWRIHNDLYDLEPFINKHPGGSDWLKLTMGTDITEAFESHHIKKSVEQLLKKFHVRPATGPRYSPYTFHEDGFYRTLKQKVQPILETLPSGPSWRSKLTSDILVTSSFVLATLAARFSSYYVGSIAGLLIALTVISAHNFFHMRDNFRMYYFNISFMSYRDWRVSHALSHHLFPNTMLDLEMFFIEKLLQWLPLESKPLWIRFGSWLYSPILYSLSFHGLFLKRMVELYKTRGKYWRNEYVIPFIMPIVMYVFGGGQFYNVFTMWSWIVVVSSFSFGFIGINAAHHHPDIFHDGDTPRVDRDWGLGQMDAVRDRPEISKSRFLVLVTFGDHCMHHLFPTVDHNYLHLLYPAFEETCRKFGVVHEPSSILELIKGQFLQLAKNKPNTYPPQTKSKLY